MNKLSYEECKQLKEAGYPFTKFQSSKHGSDRFNSDLSNYDDYYAVPTLSELIEACGGSEKSGIWLNQEFNREKITWEAGRFFWNPEKQVRGEGLTPESAVAQLWINLNKK